MAISGFASAETCQSFYESNNRFWLGFGILPSQVLDRLSVHTEVELATSVARTASILPDASLHRIQDRSKSISDLSLYYKAEVIEFSRTLLQTLDPEAMISQMNPLDAVRTIEKALRERGSELNKASMSAISLFHILKNPDAAVEVFVRMTSQMSPRFFRKSYIGEKISFLENQRVPLSAVLGAIVGLGVTAATIPLDGSLGNLILLLGGPITFGQTAQSLMKIGYHATSTPGSAVRKFWLRKSLQRSTNQFLQDETDSLRLQLFSYRFSKWRESIELNRKLGLTTDLVSRNVSETALLLAFDFPMLTLPFHLNETDYKKLTIKKYIGLTKRFKEIVEMRRSYLSEVLNVLKESLDYEPSFKDDVDAMTEYSNQLNRTAITQLFEGIYAAELILQKTLEAVEGHGQQLQLLVEGLQSADQKVESVMMKAAFQ